MVNKELTKEELLKIERNIGKILRIGVFVSTTVIIIGILMFLLSGHSGYAEGVWPDKFNDFGTHIMSLSICIDSTSNLWLYIGVYVAEKFDEMIDSSPTGTLWFKYMSSTSAKLNLPIYCSESGRKIFFNSSQYAKALEEILFNPS